MNTFIQKNHQHFYWLLLAAITLLGWSCHRKDQNISTLTRVNPYLYAYTSGYISKVAPIRVRFSEPISPSRRTAAVAAKLLSFRPKIAGTARWEDATTLLFVPDQELPGSTSFQATVAVKALFPAASGADAAFEFPFRTRDQHLVVDLDGMRPADVQNLGKQTLKGTIYSSDVAETTAIEKTITAYQNGRQLEIDWSHGTDRLTHGFVVKAVNRAKEIDGQVMLNYNGKAVKAPLQEDLTYTIPALNKFVAMAAETSGQSEPHAVLQFSDPLDKNQALDGLIRLENFPGALRYLVEENIVRVYPDRILQGVYNLRVEAGIRNLQGKSLPEAATFQLDFAAAQPQVRLVGDGVIIPQTEGLYFPFEAIGLQAVDVEIFKIYHNNIHQFLQDNPLDGGYDLYKVGRIVLQKKIDLQALSPTANAAQWTRYALDLDELIQADEQAIYQVRLGFRAEYAGLGCLGKPEAWVNTDPFANAGEEDELPRSIMDFYYGPDGYTGDYDYEKRQDPCAREYYHSERFVQRNVISSNLGIIAKQGAGGEVWVAVTDLRTTDPISGAKVDLYDFQNQLIGQSSTDGQGLTTLTSKGQPFLAIVQKGRQRGYLRLADNDALPLTRFDVAGATAQKGLKGLLYAERGVWRPGDSIFLNFMLADPSQRLPAQYPISLELYNARGQLVERRTAARQVAGIYPLPLATRPDDPTGNWRVKVKAGGAVFERALKIETVKPNRLKIDLGFADNQVLDPTGGSVATTLSAEWLTGNAGSNLRAVVEVELQNYVAQFSRFTNFSFQDPLTRLEQTGLRTIFEGQLDGAGKANISADLLSGTAAPGLLQANFRTRVFETGGDFSNDFQRVVYSPFPAYAGVAIPRNDYGEPQIAVGKSGQLRFAAVDAKGNPLAGRQLKAQLFRVEWRWWWDQDDNNMSSYNAGSTMVPLQTTTLTTNARGEATWRVTPKEWGRYLVRVSDEAGGHSGGDYLYVGYPWYDGSNTEQVDREAAAMLNFRADKTKYQVGETVRLSIPGGKAGRMLIALENGSRIIKTFWAKSTAGENEVSFKVTPDMGPTLYANVALIQPHSQVFNDLPIRLYGVLGLEIVNPATQLHPALEVAEAFQPEQKITIGVREKGGKAMAYTLALVDEGLLGLTRFKTPNPHETFYAREALSVRTWDVYDKVLGALAGKLDRILTIGGGDGLNAKALNNTANRFEPVVRHLGPFTLAAGGKNTHTLQLPNYIGAVRVMVVAVNQGAYGAAEKTVPVRSPLMVRATLPRLLAPGDQFDLPVNVIVAATGSSSAQVKVTESNGLATISNNNQTLRFPGKNADRIERFSVKMNGKPGVAKFVISAQSGNAKAREEVTLTVRNPNPFQTEVQGEVVEPGQSWRTELNPLGQSDTRTRLLEVSTVPPLNLGERLAMLLGYPYGCLEQTVSAGFPQLYLAQLQELSAETQQQIRDRINRTIDRLKGFQTSEGGFTYWPGAGNPDQWATSYTGHFLLEAKNQGYAVPQDLLSGFLKFQKKAARLWDSKLPAYGFGAAGNHELNQAYRLYTLALGGAPDQASMNRLRNNANLGATARWRLAAAYVLAGNKGTARELVADQPTTVPDYVEMAYTYGSGLRDRAMIMETLLLLDETKTAATLAQYLSTQLTSSSWYATQTVAYSLLAMAKFVGTTPPSSRYSFRYQLGSSAAQTAQSKSPLMQIQLSASATGALSFTNTSRNKLFVRYIQRAQPAPGEETAQSNALGLSVTFKDLKGAQLNPANLPQGTDFIAEVRVAHPNQRPLPYRQLALQQIFPAGWEIINNRLGDFGSTAQGAFDYQDIRDDRVNTFFNLAEGEAKTFKVMLNAAYAGRFYLPATQCAAMYDQSINANSRGQWIEVRPR